ncbi:MAG: RnfABCDGE type electron transport complex subunit B [Gammaproteobacteria bacterium]|nr:RnfABCDGE type electron transport complex subunit B [Gammaproteobacteria bacterium]
MFTGVLTLAALSFVFASLLVLAHRKLHVDEDPRIEAAQQMLPGTNCGACGYPGCLGLAEAIVDGSALPGKCTVMTEDEREWLASYLGVDVGAEEKVVARLACAGGINVARNRAHYEGIHSCRGATIVAGGGKACFWGCLGLGDCELVCDPDAIVMNEHDMPIVIEDLCTACGDCVDACPKDLFSLHPVSHRLWVACMSLEKGDAVIDDCEVGCDACGKCAVDAPDGTITMVDNLPVVDYTRNHDAREAIDRCPTGAIVWFDPIKGPVTGRAAKRVVRQSARQVTST